MTEWSALDFSKETEIGLESLNWPNGISPELIETLKDNLQDKRILDVILEQMYEEWRGFRKVGYSLRSPDVILSTASYHAFFIGQMEHFSYAASSQDNRQRIVENSNRTARQLTEKFCLISPRDLDLEELKVAVPFLQSDPTGFLIAEFLESKCLAEFGQKSSVFFGVNKAVARYKELYLALVQAGASPDVN